MAECQLPKLNVVGSTPISRSILRSASYAWQAISCVSSILSMINMVVVSAVPGMMNEWFACFDVFPTMPKLGKDVVVNTIVGTIF